MTDPCIPFPRQRLSSLLTAPLFLLYLIVTLLLYRFGAWILIIYPVVVLLYAGVFLIRICPVCAIRKKYPGGEALTALLEISNLEES